ncbi:MAG: ATP:cob(I)alamin adenosyltransferase [Candidatus Shapirobacteria bacterium]|nr:ATP:cob(I)alamin adenosyltransferase [Candidatus Shapirobacteria bacterium]MDD3002614.1 ATP:cob(I)alamin adenosyltransferase [Candidatus Shapirobacteria bacterium]
MNFVVIQNVVKNMSERGDFGKTSGECNLTVSKDSPFVEAVGAIDDFQARLGHARVLLEGGEKQTIFQVEKDLTEIMGSFYKSVDWENGKKRLGEIDDEVEEYRKRVKNLNNFLVPGENEIESRINLCRTGCRIAERRVVGLKNDREEIQGKEFDQNVLKYFNRLSTFLYFMWRSKLE